MIFIVDFVRRLSLSLSLCRNVTFLNVRIVIHLPCSVPLMSLSRSINKKCPRKCIGTDLVLVKVVSVFFATVGPFPMEMNGREPQEQGQAD